MQDLYNDLVIVSVSRRSDIPAFYADWFWQRLQQGSVTVKNPFNSKYERTISLKKKDVDAFVFWTRYPKPLFKCLDFLDGRQIPYYFLITLNNYPAIFEPNLPNLDDILTAIRQLHARTHESRIIWRYDPIVISEQTPLSFHMDNFSDLIQRLSPYSQRVIISCIDFYAKVKRRFDKKCLNTVDFCEQKDQYVDFFTYICQVAASHKMVVQSCAENLQETGVGIGRGKCIDEELLNQLFNLNLSYKKDKNQRPLCRCQQSVDIGSYNTCSYDCLYCYAR